MDGKGKHSIYHMILTLRTRMKFADEALDISGNQVRVARVISRLTPAPLFDLYVAIIIALSSPIGLGLYLNSLSVVLICLLFMVIGPIIPIVYEAWRGKIDLDVSEQSMRTKFFLWAIACYLVAFAIYWFASCVVMAVLAAAYVTVTIGVMVATRWSKVSVHTAGVGGPGTAMFFVYGIYAFPVVLVWCA
ncbi:MAG: hypothetical protein P1Q69_18660, partial [Candidatus Thorarchaeota archaeon]|nr:hypothetical protein [Candidatus Thorarchaeota archaeon]